MKTKLEEYINAIHLDKTFNYNTADYDTKLTFYGDGEGDFEESSFDVDKELVLDYINYCKEQIGKAEEHLRKKENNEDRDWFKFNMTTGRVDT